MAISTRPSLRVRVQLFFARYITPPRLHRVLYRATGGVVGARLPGVRPPVLLLTARGRRTGQPRTTPTIFFTIKDRVVIAGTNNGDDRDPAWCANLRADPAATIQIGRDRRAVRARFAAGPERERLWAAMKEEHPLFAAYEERTRRETPVIVLEEQW